MFLPVPLRSARTRLAANAANAAPRPIAVRLVLGLGLLVGAVCAMPSRALAQGRPGGGGQGGGGQGGGGGRMSFAGDRGNSPSFGRASAATGPHLSLPGRWWDDNKTVKKIGLRSTQQRRMDEIFNANKGNLLNLLGNLQMRETHLTSMSPAELQDEGKVFAAIDSVSEARAELEKAKAHTMVLIRQQMDTNQLSMLDREIATAR